MIPEYFAYLCIVFGFAGSFFYIRDIFRGKAKPNRVSWIFWMIAPFVAVYIGFKSGVHVPLLISTFLAGFVPFLVLIATFFNKDSYWKTTKFDIFCGMISAITIIIWITTKLWLLLKQKKMLLNQLQKMLWQLLMFLCLLTKLVLVLVLNFNNIYRIEGFYDKSKNTG